MASSFKRTRGWMEKAVAGEPVQGDLKDKIGKAEKSLKTFKDDFQRYGALSRSYDRKLYIDREAEKEAEKEAEEAEETM